MSNEVSSFDRVIGLVGLIIGIPGFLALFVSTHWVEGLLALLLALGAFGYYIHRWSEARKPLFTNIQIQKTLTFQDASAHAAKFETQATVRANHEGTQIYWFRNISADGSIQNIKIDGLIPPTGAIRTVAATREVSKEFDVALEKGKSFTVTLSYDLMDSFPSQKEGMTHITPTETKVVKLIVNFHEHKRIRDVWFYLGVGGEKIKELEKPKILQVGNSQRVEVEYSNPRPGSHLTLQWEW